MQKAILLPNCFLALSSVYYGKTVINIVNKSPHLSNCKGRNNILAIASYLI